MGAPTTQGNEAAKHAYRFDNDDLIENRAGRLSDRQLAKLWPTARTAAAIYLVDVLILLLSLLVLSLQIGSRIDDRESYLVASLVLFTTVAVTVAAVAAVALWWRRHGSTVRKRTVRVVSGPIHIGDSRQKRKRTVTVGDGDTAVQFPLLDRAADVWRGADTATVYYTVYHTVRGTSTRVHSIEMPAADPSNRAPIAPGTAHNPSEPTISHEALKKTIRVHRRGPGVQPKRRAQPSPNHTVHVSRQALAASHTDRWWACGVRDHGGRRDRWSVLG